METVLMVRVTAMAAVVMAEKMMLEMAVATEVATVADEVTEVRTVPASQFHCQILPMHIPSSFLINLHMQ